MKLSYYIIFYNFLSFKKIHFANFSICWLPNQQKKEINTGGDKITNSIKSLTPECPKSL
jgi:hypothetical protein